MSQNLVVPSRAEAMPYIVLEGLGAGKTIIATRVGGIPEALGKDSPAQPRGYRRSRTRHGGRDPHPNDVLKLYHDLLDPQSKQAIALAS